MSQPNVLDESLLTDLTRNGEDQRDMRIHPGVRVMLPSERSDRLLGEVWREQDHEMGRF
jgi:hypothetical protein